MNHRVSALAGIDVGGTFTDFISYLEPGGLRIAKRPTTPHDQSVAIDAGLAAMGAQLADLDQIVHGTTTATNAVIERTVARCALVTCRGFRDVLECGRRDRPSLYGLRADFTPLIDRASRFEIGGRLDAAGREIEPVDGAELQRLAGVIAAGRYDAVAICLLHAYANSAHERLVEAQITEAMPDVYVVRSSALHPSIGEFERTSTTVISAAIGPLVRRYFGRLDDRLRTAGFGRDFMVVQSSGGATSHRIAARFPATTINSGPAAGVTAAVATAVADGIADVITLDMGGTSADIAVAVGGRIGRSSEHALGFRMPLQVPRLDISAIGAGGGSIAWLDGSGILRVGPQSAGSVPGPACYGEGGSDATVTDAHVVLGHMVGEALVRNGVERLDPALAEGAISASIAEPLGLDVQTAAEAMLEVANENMAGQIRLVTIERGLDVRRFALVAYGGAGPLHACALLRKTGLRAALIPVFPGITSALGCTLCDVRHELVQAMRVRLDDLEPGALAGIVGDQRERGRAILAAGEMPASETRQDVSVAMLYEGQRHTIDVDLGTVAANGSVSALTADDLARAFDRRHSALYGSKLDRGRVVMGIRSSIYAPLGGVALSDCFAALRGSEAVATSTERRARFGGRSVLAAVRDRKDLPPGSTTHGPAVVVQADSTTLLEPGFQATVTPAGALLITRAPT